jgi:acetoin utilization deacetylase AcuC-like enzyme
LAELYHPDGESRLQLFYCDQYHFPLAVGHKFPLAKYRLLRETLSGDPAFELRAAPLVSRENILRVHSAGYCDGFLNGGLDAAAMRRIGFPWSPELVRRTLASAGATLQAAHAALASGVAGTLAGGTHHAFPAQGAGFCVFNDLAIAIEDIRATGKASRIAVVDLDVHQGDGTAAIFANDAGVFTLSMHGKNNFPFRKQRSRLDIELGDGTADDEYLKLLESALQRVWEFGPELVLYQSGVDGLGSDRLGRLSLTLEGLRRRDECVMAGAKLRRVPLAITLGGGYSEPVELTVEAHANTFRLAWKIYDR